MLKEDKAVGDMPLIMLWSTLGVWRGDRNQFYHIGVVLERHGLKQLKESMPAKQPQTNRIERIHEPPITVEFVPLPIDFSIDNDGMEIGEI